MSNIEIIKELNIVGFQIENKNDKDRINQFKKLFDNKKPVKEFVRIFINSLKFTCKNLLEYTDELPTRKQLLNLFNDFIKKRDEGEEEDEEGDHEEEEEGDGDDKDNGEGDGDDEEEDKEEGDREQEQDDIEKDIANPFTLNNFYLVKYLSKNNIEIPKFIIEFFWLEEDVKFLDLLLFLDKKNKKNTSLFITNKHINLALENKIFKCLLWLLDNNKSFNAKLIKNAEIKLVKILLQKSEINLLNKLLIKYPKIKNNKINYPIKKFKQIEWVLENNLQTPKLIVYIVDDDIKSGKNENLKLLLKYNIKINPSKNIIDDTIIEQTFATLNWLILNKTKTKFELTWSLKPLFYACKNDISEIFTWLQKQEKITINNKKCCDIIFNNASKNILKLFLEFDYELNISEDNIYKLLINTKNNVKKCSDILSILIDYEIKIKFTNKKILNFLNNYNNNKILLQINKISKTRLNSFVDVEDEDEEQDVTEDETEDEEDEGGEQDQTEVEDEEDEEDETEIEEDDEQDEKN